MSAVHDPSRYLNFLQQCLCQNKRRIGFVIGAGCPTSIRVSVAGRDEPLIPDIQGLTKVVADHIRTTALTSAFDKIENHLVTDGHTVRNIETQLSFVRGLKAIVGSGSVRELAACDLEALEDEMCKVIGDRVKQELPRTDNGYSQLALWIASTNRAAPVEIFTTNYDLLAEQAFERHRIPYFDGFSGSGEAFLDSHTIDDDDLPPRWARLWKLHGSINWTTNSSNQVCRIGNPTGKCMIHPSHLKYDESRRMPYLVMIDRFRAFLRTPSSALIVCGYSFGDEHLNACLLEALTGSPLSAVFGLLFNNLADYPEATKLAGMVGNLSILAKDGAVIGTQLGKWDNRDPGDWGASSGALASSTISGSGKAVSFHLGDFARLGRFLAALIGSDGPSHAI
jgi:hypothetical protein